MSNQAMSEERLAEIRAEYEPIKQAEAWDYMTIVQALNFSVRCAPELLAEVERLRTARHQPHNVADSDPRWDGSAAGFSDLGEMEG
jgi:hypothetical protein